MTTSPELAIINAIISNAFKQLMANPEIISGLMTSLFSGGCHNAVDVAQDALDAYDHGHLTREQALQIVTICLQKQNPTIDITAKRIEIEKLFNS
jgi:hypothetical protein